MGAIVGKFDQLKIVFMLVPFYIQGKVYINSCSHITIFSQMVTKLTYLDV